MLHDIGTQVVADSIYVPLGCVQQPLHAVGGAIPRDLRDVPARFPFARTQQGLEIVEGTPAGGRPPKMVCSCSTVRYPDFCDVALVSVISTIAVFQKYQMVTRNTTVVAVTFLGCAIVLLLLALRRQTLLEQRLFQIGEISGGVAAEPALRPAEFMASIQSWASATALG